MSFKKKSFINPEKLVSIISRYNLIVIIPLIMLLFIHVYSANLPITDKWAEQSVESYYLNLHDSVGMNSFDTSPKIKEASQNYKKIFHNKDGGVYLYGVDSYFFLDQAEDVLHGQETDSFLPVLEAFSYRIISSIFGISLIRVAFWLPTFFSMLSVLLIFFIGKKLTNSLGGFFAAFLLSIHPQFFTATQAGFADTNFLNLFFSILIVFLFFHVLDFKLHKSLKETLNANIRPLACLALLIISLFLFRFTWGGYFYIAALILFYSLAYILVLMIHKGKSGDKRYYKYAALFVFLLIILSVFLSSMPVFESTAKQVKDRIGLFDLDTYFPSALSTTSELFSAKQRMDITNPGKSPFLYVMNGFLMTFIMFISLLLVLLKNRKFNEKTRYSLFVLFWFIIMFYVGFSAIRFLSFFALPYVLLASYGLSVLARIADRYVQKLSKRSYINFIIAIFCFLILISFFSLTKERTERVPFMNSVIEETANRIRLKAPEDYSVNQWWDKGYLYEHYLDHEVLMDNSLGGSSDPRLYWFSLILMSNNEENAIRILKMLDCGVYHQDPNVNLSEISCNLPQAYLILDSGLLGKVDIFRYYADWDFDAKKHKPFSFPAQPSLSQPTNCWPNTDKTTLTCGSSFVLNINTGELLYNGKPFPVVVVSENSVFESNETGPYTFVVYPENNIYRAVLMKSDLVYTTFSRLFFMKGLGLDHFELFSDIYNPVVGRYLVYKIKWD